MEFEQQVDTMIKQDFLECLKALAWCKQGEETLVAVHKCTPEIIAVMKERSVKIFPGGMVIKANKSWLHSMKDQFEDGMPVPLLLVWKKTALELWYRRHKPMEFPYDTWSDPAAAAYEREQVSVQDMEPELDALYQELLAKVKPCPSVIPPQ